MSAIIRPPVPMRPVRKPYTPEKLGRPKAMTTIAGLRIGNGILLAADSEITEGTAKYAESKLFSEQINPAVSLAFAYSGSRDYAIMAIQQILSVVRSSQLSKHPAIYGAVKDTIEEIHTNSIGCLPELDQSDASFCLLIGIWADGMLKLLTTERTAVVEESRFRCFGMGKALAKYLLDVLYYNEPERIERRTAEMAALRMLTHAKESAGFTGKEREILFLDSNGLIQKKTEDNYHWEFKVLESYDGVMGFLFPILTDLNASDDDLDATVHLALDLHKKTLLQIRLAQRQIPKTGLWPT